MPTARAENLYFYKQEPLKESGGGRTWYGRAQNLLVAYSKLEPKDELAVANLENEYFVILIEGSIDVSSEKGSASVTGPAQVIVPPGKSSITGTSSATLVSATTSDQKWKNVPLRIASTAHSGVAW